MVEKAWCSETAATVNLKFKENFNGGLPKKLRDFAHKRQITLISTLLEPFIHFHTLVTPAYAEDSTNEKIRTIDLTLEIINVTSKRESEKLSAETYDPNPEVMCTQTTNANNKTKPQFRKYCNFFQKSNHSVSNCFCKQREKK